MTKRYFSIFLAFIMIFSLFFQPVLNDVYANKTDAVSLVSLKKDFVITDDTNQILGTISKDAEIFVKKTENGNYVFDWLGKEMELPQDQFELSESQLNYYNVNGENSSIVDFKSFKERVKVSDPTSNKTIAYIEPNQNIPFIEENENKLKIIIGNREGIITLKKTDQATDANTELPVQEKDVNNKESVPDSNDVNTENDFKNSEEINKQTEGTNNRENQQTSLTQNIKEKQLNNEILSFTKNIKYFKALEDLAVFVKRNGKLVKVGTLEKGQTYPRIRDYGNWHEIRFGKYKGYVHKNGTAAVLSPSIKNINKSYKISSYLLKITQNAQVYDNSSGKLVKFGEIYKGNEYPVIGDYGKWWRIDYLGRIGYIQKSQGELLFTANIKYFQVIQDQTPVYIKGKDKLVKVGMLEKGQTYPRIRDYGNWHEIRFGKYKGYVHKNGTAAVLSPSIKNINKSYKISSYLLKITKNAQVYDNSSGKLVKFGEIYKGNEYPVVADYGKWWRIDYLGRIGYIQKSQGELLFTANTKYFQVTRDNTPIYIKGKDKLVKVGMLEKGQTYPRIRDYGNWHEIQFGSKKGYIHKLSTVPAIKFGQKKVGQSKTNIGTFVALKNAVIYDNSGKKLVPFATISKNIEYPIEAPYGNWVKIHIANRVGYVHKSDVKVSLKKQAKPGNLVNPNQVYTYEEMVRDISELEKAYPNLISKRIIGQSVDGRNIYAVKLGKGKTEIMINGSHHAREYITTNLLMEMIDVYAYAYSKNLRVDGYPVRSILNNASIWFVPMVNPDGVTLVQKGHRSAKNPAYVLKLNGGSTNFAAWKANIRGVDLNRQYPADWYRIAGNTGRPSPQNYKGPRPLNEPEAKAMVNFTLSRNFKTAVSYHSSGEIIYWHFNTPKQHEVRDRKIASMIASKTGYRLVPPSNNPSGGGFTDWFISTQKKPAFTPEVAPYVGNRPVPISYFPSIWKKNQSIGIMLADEAYKNRNTR
ncbi:M14 family zinc carboxypeptidase [Aeribacillus composti]|uniref:M14 family metallocarboxypeptidase n=1 Tax=Aeribacillus composti TaxID=1868734 RepID=UPI003D262949